MRAIHVCGASQLKDVAKGEYRFGLLTIDYSIGIEVLMTLSLALVFMSPELVQLSEWKDTLSGSVMKSKLSMVAIDEAHCISEWLVTYYMHVLFLNLKCTCRGHNFRTAFSKIGALRALTSVPFMALTASAPSDVQVEITNLLHMSTPVIVSCSLDRPNIYLSTSQVKSLNVSL